MSEDSNKALVRRLFEEVWNRNDATAAKQLVADHYTSPDNPDFSFTPGPKVVADELKLYGELYDGLNFKIERMMTEGNSVVTVWQASGTSKTVTFVNRKGETVPKTLQAEGMSLTEIKDGKITAHRFLWPRDPLFP